MKEDDMDGKGEKCIQNFCWKLGGQKPLRRHRQDNIKLNLKEVGWNMWI